MAKKRPPAATWRIDPAKVHDVALQLADDLSFPIDSRATNEVDKRMYELYLQAKKDGKSSWDATDEARAKWVEEVLLRMLCDE